MPPRRRRSDRRSVRALGWAACFVLAGSLTYAFIHSLDEGPDAVDPWFFGFQAGASSLFLLYSVRLRNAVFVVANVVALLNALGTLGVWLWG